MKNGARFLRRSVFALACAAAFLAGASRQASAEPAGSRIAAHYRKHHDFESLQKLLAHLPLGLSRKAVEALLGKPTYCPVPDQCYYHSDRVSDAGVAITLVIEYRVYYLDDRDPKSTGRIESLMLGPVGE